MAAKGLPTGNAPILASITVQLRVALGGWRLRGWLRRSSVSRAHGGS